MKRAPPWPSEAAMFVPVTDAFKRLGFTVYPEHAGFDAVLQAPATLHGPLGDVSPGDILAIQGKLRANVTLLRQALPRWRRRCSYAEPFPSAHWYVALVPHADPDFREVAEALGLVVLEWPNDPRRPPALDALGLFRGAFRCLEGDLAPLPLPDVVVEQPCGAPAPRLVTPWKLAAVRLCLDVLSRPDRRIGSPELRGRDLTAAVWLTRGWLRSVARAVPPARGVVYELQDAPDRPDRLYPEIVAALLKEDAKGRG